MTGDTFWKLPNLLVKDVPEKYRTAHKPPTKSVPFYPSKNLHYTSYFPGQATSNIERRQNRRQVNVKYNVDRVDLFPPALNINKIHGIQVQSNTIVGEELLIHYGNKYTFSCSG